MTTKTSSKASGLRQLEFDYSKSAYRTKSSETRLRELLAIRGVYRGSDQRFVGQVASVNTTQMRKTK